jgi:endonuclease/exonuclease/phosphatase family metal-dependent hydrolase
MAVFAIIFIAHLFGGAWIMENWHAPAQSREPADLRVLHWNVARPWAFRTEIMMQVKAYDADVIAISEAVPLSGRGEQTPRTRIVADEWRTSFPDFSYEQGEKGLACLIKGEVLQRRIDTLHPGSVYVLYDARVKGRPVRILQVDIDARPVHPRRKALATLVELVGTLADQPLILVGDFNTPRDSVHLEPLSKQHAACLAFGRRWIR